MGKHSTDRRLWLAITRLIFGILAISFFLYYFVAEVQHFQYYNTILQNAAGATYVADFTHLSSAERGRSAIYLTLPTPARRQVVIDAHTATNSHIPGLLAILANYPNDVIFELLSNLSNVQDQVLASQISPTDAFKFYTNLNGKLIRILYDIIFYDNVDLTKDLHCLLYLSWYLEWFGQERAVISRVLASQSFGDEIAFCELYFGILKTQQFVLEQLKLSLSASTLALYNEIIADPAFVKTMNYVTALRADVVLAISFNNNYTNNFFNYSISDYWGNTTYILQQIYLTISPDIESRVSTTLESYKSTSETGLVIAILGTFFEFLAISQLIWVALPVFRLYLLWNKPKSGTKKGSSLSDVVK